MLIINADDYGKNEISTNNIIICNKKDTITSVSAMVFMADSERASELALENHLDIGLHLNFDHKFDGHVKSFKLNEYHQLVAAFLSKNKYGVLIYHPLLRRQFEYIYKTQYEEYVHLYHQEPTHIDGHRHLHLCMNMIIDRIIPPGSKIRKNFTFFKGEKSLFNIFYRKILDRWLAKRYICTDYFFDISPVNKPQRIQQIVALSKSFDVELMVHPERSEEYNFLMSNEYQQMISIVKKCNYSKL